jgi:hypothetical protein
LNPAKILLFSFFLCSGISHAQQVLKGFIVERDSATTMPFVYIINKSNGNGTMSNNEGKFTLVTSADDTLICSYVGFAKSFIPVKSLRPDASGNVKIVMTELPINLNTVTISAFRFKSYERDYMNDIIERSRIKPMSYANAPISALYARFSREGRQVRKLAQIFEELMIEEQVQKKLSPEILSRLTGDYSLDYKAFRKYCYAVSDYFIVTHDGADLYSKVMECYNSWKDEGR